MTSTLAGAPKMETTLTQCLLPETDIRFLADKGYKYSEEDINGWVHVILHDFPLPTAYIPQTCRLLIRIPPGYPNANPDMFWTQPDIKLGRTGAWPQSADYHEDYNGQSWQRWSRHIPSNRWRPGTDTLQTFLRTIRQELQRGV